jgi:hypothetical protein
MPRSGFQLFTQTLASGMNRADRARLMQEHNVESDHAMREMRRAYHERFRARVLAELQRPGREALLQAHGTIARDPQGVPHIEKLSRTITRLAGAQAERPGLLATTREATRDARERHAGAGRRNGGVSGGARPGRPASRAAAPAAPRGAATPSARQEIEQSIDRHKRQTEVAFYTQYQQRGLDLFDRAHEIGLVGSDERVRVAHPRGEVDPIAPWLRDLATDLDGQAS